MLIICCVLGAEVLYKLNGPADILNIFTSLLPLLSQTVSLTSNLFSYFTPSLTLLTSAKMPVPLLPAVSPVASWSSCWYLKTRVIQVEQEGIVSRIWVLGTEAGHRSHEGANAHSALVDWSWLYPTPTTTTSLYPPLALSLAVPCSLFLLTHASLFYGHLFVLHFSSDQTSTIWLFFTVKPAVLSQREVEQINNHLHAVKNCSASL